jgi:hypothetical protein
MSLLRFYKAHIISFPHIIVTDLQSMRLVHSVFPGVWCVCNIVVQSDILKSHFNTALHYWNKTNFFSKRLNSVKVLRWDGNSTVFFRRSAHNIRLV